MDKWLALNLEKIPSHLRKGWDVVAIVSGTGLVRTGKSTLAMQMAQYVAWCIAGGKMLWDEEGRVTGIIPPNKEVKFGLDHVVFSPEELIKVTKEKGAHAKYNVFVLDEGREGLLGARVMETVNKRFEDYFQTCGVYNNFIIIVLPDFFKLAEQYCVNRSMFLVNVFHKNYERGYFSFFNTLQKERLYFFGKKRLGISARYSAASRNFWGRFSKWLPFDENQYNAKKKAAIGKAKWTKYDVAQMRQRDLLSYIVYKNTNFTINEIAQKMAELGAPEYTDSVVERSLRNAKRILESKKFIVDEDQEPGQPVEQDVTFDNMDEGALEIVKDPRPDMQGYNREYDNTDLTSKTFVHASAEGEHKNILPQAADEIKVADDPYGDDGITQQKYQLPDRRFSKDTIAEHEDPDAAPFPDGSHLGVKKIPGVPMEFEESFEKLNERAIKTLEDAEKNPMSNRKTYKVKQDKINSEKEPEHYIDFKEEFKKLQQDQKNSNKE